jgi:hypothetical protein
VKGDNSIVCWRDKKEVYLFTGMQIPPAFVVMDEDGTASE